MAVLPIHKIGGAVDTSELSAGPGDVLSPEKFIGSGSDENQQGNIPIRGVPSYTLPLNGSQSLPAGHYSGGSISQSIPTMGAQSVGPGSQMITIPTAGKYMTGNITIRTTKNLIPSVIKKDAIVGGVKGNFEGYVITDPKTLYKYGTFNGIQTITGFKRFSGGQMGSVDLERDNIKTTVLYNFRQVAIVFNAAIDFTNLSKLTIRHQSKIISDGSAAGMAFSIFRNRVTDYMYNDTVSNPNPALGTKLLGNNMVGSGGDYTFNVASITGNAYLYLEYFYADSVTNVMLVSFE